MDQLRARASRPTRLGGALVAGLVVALCLLLGPGAAHALGGRAPSGAAGRAPGGDRPVVVVGLTGLTAADLGPRTTPRLWGLADRGATGALVVRSVHPTTCPADGWLTLGAGGRVAQRDAPGGTAGPGGAGPGCDALPRPPTTPAASPVPGWAGYADAARSTRQDARLGALAATLHEAGACVSAVGPGAGLAAAGPEGRVARWAAYDPTSLRTDLSACPVALVDVGVVAPGAGRASSVTGLDARVGQVLDAAPAGATVVVATLADGAEGARLRPVAVREAGDLGTVRGELRSPSTRQPGYVLLTDLAPTVARWVGAEPDSSWRGSPLVVAPDSAGAAPRVRAVQDRDTASHEVTAVALPFWLGWAAAALGCGLVLLLTRRRTSPAGVPGGAGVEALAPAADGGVRLLARGGLVVLACVPAATYLAGLVPWWRAPAPRLVLPLVVLALAGLLGAVALAGPWRRHPYGPPAAVAALTALVLVGDALTGSRLMMSTLLGEQPVVAGRFYGFGNVAFALLATCVLLLMVAVAALGRAHGRPRAGALAALGLGLAAVAVDGMPWWGADLGGPVALLPAVALLGLVALGVRLTWQRLFAVGAVSLAAVVALAVVDHRRPPESRSHLGRFVQTVLDGGAGDVVLRKGEQNLQMLLHAPAAFLVPLGLVLAVWALARPRSALGRPVAAAYDRVPLLRAGLAAILLMMVIGFATNDSGVAIPPVGATILLPLLVVLGTAPARGR